MKARALGVTLAACALAWLAMSSPAQAVTFVFDYYDVNPHTSPFALTGPGGPWGTLVVTNSIVDPNRRVDILLTVTPPAAYAGAQLEQFYMNFDSDPAETPAGNDPDFLTNHQFYLVKQTAPAGGVSNTPFAAGDILGSVGYANGAANGSFDFANFVFDLNPNATSGALVFAGSLALYDKLPNPDVPVDLNASMFDIQSVFKSGVPTPQTIPMWAAYRLNNFNPNPPDPNFPNGEFWAFASSRDGFGQVPEPLTMLGLFMGLGGVGAYIRKRRQV